MLMRMIYDDALAQAAYLIGCQKTGEAIVIDPERDVDRYLDLASQHALRITACAETHIHADFLSGCRELVRNHGVRAYLSDEGGPDWSYAWARDAEGQGEVSLVNHADSFMIGNIELRVLHTPGHTPEHIVFLVIDHGSGADEPIAMVSGDFLFVGDLGRPDLLESAAGVAGAMEPSARRLLDSVRSITDIPDFVQVWPGHGAGSACGKALGAVPTSTLGYERRFNESMRAASDDQTFIDFILSGQPEPPLYFAEMKRLNQEGPPLLNDLPTPPIVGPAELLGAPESNRIVIDTRPWPEFRDAHLPGSLSFPRIPSFLTDLGSMVGLSDELYLVVDAASLDQVVRECARIGIDRIAGWCPPATLGEFPGEALVSTDEIEAADAAPRVEAGEFGLLDVRRATEFGDGHIPGACNFSHTRLASHMGEIPTTEPLLINCRSGVRSARAAALLERAGRRVVNLKGGFLAWNAAGCPVER